MMAKHRGLTPWLIVCCGTLFYCFNYFLRVSPSTMQDQLTQAFHITATQFGTLAVFYYWAYTPMQLPAGLLYDKFGVRVVLSAACLIAVTGLALFVEANSYAMAGAGRFLIGLGCAFSYIGTLKLASLWLPPHRFATAAGFTTAAGMASGALAQKYLTHMVDALGYKNALHSCLLIGFVLSVLLITFVRNQPKTSAKAAVPMQNPINTRQLFNALKFICSSRQMWLIGAIGCLLYLPSSVFLDVWGIPYLKAVYNLTPEQATSTTGFTFWGWILAGPIIGMVSDRIQLRKLPLIATGFFAAVLLCCVFYIPNFATLSTLNLIFFFVGFCCGAHHLCFALAKESNPIQISGTAVAVTNMLIMTGGSVFQPVVGKLLDLHATTMGANGLPIYNASDYAFALSVIPLGVCLGIILATFLKETHCQSQATPAQERLVTGIEGDVALEPAG